MQPECFAKSEKLCLHTKKINTLQFDYKGNRLVSTSADGSVAYWDFPSMKSDLTPFRVVEPDTGVPTSFAIVTPNNSFKHVLVGSGHSVYAYDGLCIFERKYASGDPYIRDLTKTIGHVGVVRGALWLGGANLGNAGAKGTQDYFLTWGIDGTCRWWSLQDKFNVKVQVIPQVSRGTGLTFVKIFNDRFVLCAMDGGVLKCFRLNERKWKKVVIEIRAHSQDITCMQIDGNQLITRSLDGTLKLWLIRCHGDGADKDNKTVSSIELVHSWSGLESSSTSPCAFVGDDLIVTGSTRTEKGESGQVLAYNKNSFQLEYSQSFPHTSVTALTWHPKIKQLAIGLATGEIVVFYGNDSVKGIIPCLAVPTRKRTSNAAYKEAEIVYLPNAAIPSGRNLIAELEEARGSARQCSADPSLAHHLEKPIEGPGKGGRLGSSLTHTIMKTVVKNTIRDDDPREALLKYSQVCENDPRFVVPAYAERQPEVIFDTNLPSANQQQQEEEEGQAKREQLEKSSKRHKQQNK